MSCSIGVIIDAAENKDIRFTGKQLKKHKDFQKNDIWCEVTCTRKDDHPTIGKHWYEKGGLRIEFEIEEDSIWMV